jgi:hypothetical protein
MATEVFPSECRPPVKTKIYNWVDQFVLFLCSELSPERTLPIFIGETWSKEETPHIYYNCEQLTRKDLLIKKVLPRATQEDVSEIWDYSLVNIEILKQHGVTARYVPLQTPESYLQRLREFRNSQPIEWDIGFCGSTNGIRRLLVLAQLKKQGLLIRIVKSTGEQRDRELAQCRVMLNIHYSPEYTVWESHRCQTWLDIGVPVISENSLDNHPGCINVSIKELVGECIRQIKHLNSPH